MGAWRDRHDRGLRGSLAPSEIPIAKTRSEQFDDLVLDAVDHLERRWADQLRGIKWAVEDVPDSDADVSRGSRDGPIPLSRLFPAIDQRPTRIVIYRRPLEVRAIDRTDLADLVHDVVVEEVADFLGLDPEVVDPLD